MHPGAASEKRKRSNQGGRVDPFSLGEERARMRGAGVTHTGRALTLGPSLADGRGKQCVRRS